MALLPTMSRKVQHFRMLACLIFLTFALLAQSQSCYYPDGSIAVDDTPCSSAAGTVCCGPGFACLENRVCQVTTEAQDANPDLNKNIVYIRGSCSDQTWASPGCPQFCIGTQYNDDGGNSMTYCSADVFCCLGGDCDCTTGYNVTTFDLAKNESVVAYTTVGLSSSVTNAVPAASSSTADSSISISSAESTAESTSSASPTTSQPAATSETASSSPTPTPTLSKSGLSTGAKAGIGVGVALGVVLLAVIGFLFWRTHRQHKELEGLNAQRSSMQPSMQYQNQYQDQHQSVMSGPSELSGQASAAAWSQKQNPATGYYYADNPSTSPKRSELSGVHEAGRSELSGVPEAGRGTT